MPLYQALSFALVSDTNILAGRPITIFQGECTAGSGCGATERAFVTDGVFEPNNTLWTVNTLWWSDADLPNGPVFLIELDDVFEISALHAQVDCQDDYYILYRYYTPSKFSI